uniref:Uncharacterized protein n=1 Tax=Pelusios castaneus TaxID=367368 RepID=A0A8C8RXT7_9SAUR
MGGRQCCKHHPAPSPVGAHANLLGTPQVRPALTFQSLFLLPKVSLTFSPGLPASPSSPARPGTPGIPGLPGSPAWPGSPSGPRSPTARPMGPWGPAGPSAPLSPLGPLSPGKPITPYRKRTITQLVPGSGT